MTTETYRKRIPLLLGSLVVLAGLIFWIASVLALDGPPDIQGQIVLGQSVDTSRFELSSQISFGLPLQLDSSKAMFVVPVGQKSQLSKRSSSGLIGLMDDYDKNELFEFHGFSGLYNNLIFIRSR